MAPLPLFKIFAVLFKEVSKPLAASLKRYASEHPALRDAAMLLGRSYEHGVQRTEVLFSGKGRIKSFKPIPDAHALSVGADLLTQGVLISSAIGLACAEYWRSLTVRDAERAAAAERKEERRGVKDERLRGLEGSIAAALARIAELERAAALAAERERERDGAAGAAAAAEEARVLVAAAARERGLGETWAKLVGPATKAAEVGDDATGLLYVRR